MFALLGALLAQVLTGLMADDEIAFSGPLTRFVSGDTVAWATSLHTDVGQWLLVALVALHLAAIAFYTHIKRHSLVRPMVLGDKQLPASTPASRDDARTRLLAAVVLAAAAAVAWWVAQLGVF